MNDFRPLSDLARFVLDLLPGQTVIPAEHLEAAAELVTGPPVTAADFDLWAAELDDNPLATGHYCPTCLTRLDKPERPCPLGCKENAR